MAALEATMRTIGLNIPPECLVLIETTVAPGTTEFVAWPILKKAFAKRGLTSEPILAHSFERVMPGATMSPVSAIFGACAPDAIKKPRTRREIFDRSAHTKEFPLTVMDRPIESENHQNR
jgi:UDP-N-acetyl-D-mannosaminuronate dehydrogenase